MTHEEILAQAKEGGFAVVRLPITLEQKRSELLFPFPSDDTPDGYTIATPMTDGRTVAIHDGLVLSIEMPPLSEADALRARVAELEKQLDALHQGYDVVRAQAVGGDTIPPHNLPGFGPIKAGPPFACLKEFAAFFCGAWHIGYHAPAWQHATAHAMRGE